MTVSAWISPGGEKKILYCNNTPTITWWNKKKILRIEDAGNSLTEKLMSSLCCQNVVADNDSDSAICPSTLGHGCRCKELSVDMEGTKLDVAIVESKHGKMIDKNSQEISQMKCEVNNIVSQLGNINNIANHLEEARAAIDEYDESTEVIARLRNENALLINSLNVITRELEKYRTLDIKENSGSNKLNESIVEVVTTNANYGSGEVIAEITNNRRDNHLHQLETPLMFTANDHTLTVKDHSNHSSITPDQAAIRNELTTTVEDQSPKSDGKIKIITRQINGSQTLDKRSPENTINNLSNRPKHQTPCPFLRKRGFCKKGRSCDFLHQNFLHQNPLPPNVKQSTNKNSMGFIPFPPQRQPNVNQPLFPLDFHHFPPFEHSAYYPRFRQYPYPPPLMSLPTVYPSMSPLPLVPQSYRHQI